MNQVVIAARGDDAASLQREGDGLNGHVPPSLDGLREGLKALGYEEGKSLQLDLRNVADETAARSVALELVKQRPDLIVTFENQARQCLRRSTKGKENSVGPVIVE